MGNHMGNYGEQLVGGLRHVALKASSRGLHLIEEGAAAATRALEQLQEKLAQYEPVDTPDKREAAKSEPVSAVQEQARETAKVLLEEVQAVEERIKRARPARNPLQVTVEATPEPQKPRTQGRKTTASASAPKRSTAKTGGFKAKRGQKHSHNH